MPHLHRPGACEMPQLRRFAEPPHELKTTIENVAEYVAEHGPGAEFQLRSGKDGRRRMPFLFLDNEFAPYYHYRLREARQSRETNVMGGGLDGVPVVISDSSGENERILDMRNPADPFGFDPLDLGDFSYLYKYVHHETNDAPASDGQAQARYQKQPTDLPAPFQRNHTCPGQTTNNIPNPFSTPQHPRSHDPFHLENFDSAHRRTTSGPPASDQGTLPYNLLQEVHLLDSDGTERTGLNTFVVISNDVQEAADPSLVDVISNSPARIVGEPPIYRLLPDLSVTFRARHQRLLPVGFAMGAEVEIVGENGNQGKKKEDHVVGVVVRRIVVRGQRLYDVKDEKEVVWKDVAEDALRLHNGGRFGFRMAN